MAFESLKWKTSERLSSYKLNQMVDALNYLFDLSYPSIKVLKAVFVKADYSPNPFEFVIVDASSKAVTISLPTAGAYESIIVKKIDSTSNPVNIVPPSGKTVDNAAQISLTSPMSAVILVADDNGNWWVVARA